MSIKGFSFSEIKEKAEKLAEIWRTFSAWESPDDFLAQNEFAPLIGAICDQWVDTEDAWNFPRWLYSKVGKFDLPELLGINYEEMLKEYFKDKWPEGMKKNKRQELLKGFPKIYKML